MDAEFWHARWTQNRIGFHETEGNALFRARFGALNLPVGSRVFVPLAGKSRDINWLLDRGYRVVASELSARAVEAWFAERGVTPGIMRAGALTRYRGPGLVFHVGDVFQLRPEDAGRIDAVYDRAALVALPAAQRLEYAAHIHHLAGGAPQLLLCFEYDQARMPGPPFSVDRAELMRVYGRFYALRELARCEVPGKLKRKVEADEVAWLLSRLAHPA